MTHSPVELGSERDDIKAEPISQVTDRPAQLRKAPTPTEANETPVRKRLDVHLATPPTEQIERSAQVCLFVCLSWKSR